MSLLALSRWLADTPWSIALHESTFGYPIVESIHVWALCLFVGMAVVLDLRLIGIGFRKVPVSEIAERILPWAVVGFVLMVISGVLLVYAIPVRSYQNLFMRVKVALMVLAGINAWVFHSQVYRKVTDWDRDPIPPRAARIAGTASLVLWIGIIFCGRMIAYNWFDCDKPQSRVIKILAGCASAQGARR